MTDQAAPTTTGETLEWSVIASLLAELAAYRARRSTAVGADALEHLPEAA